MRPMALVATSALLLGMPGMAAAAPRVTAIAIRDAVIRPVPAGQPMTAAYMTVVNATARPLVLKGVACACAASVTAHRTRMAGGIMQMRSAADLTVPAHGALTFKPGGLHLMVMGVKGAIKPGDHLPMRVSFVGMAPLTVRFTAAR